MEDYAKTLMTFLIQSNYPDTAKVYRQLVALDRFEKKYGKSIIDFNKDEILQMYKELNFGVSTLTEINNYLLAFAEWNEKLDSSYKDIKFDELFKVKKEEDILSFFTIRDIIKTLDNYTDRFLILGIFEGITGPRLHEITLAKIEDIDTQKSTMKIYDAKGDERIFDREIKISNNLLLTALEANKEKEYRGDNFCQKYDNMEYIIGFGNKRINENETVEEIAEKRYRTLHSRLKTISKNTKVPFTFKTLKMSGIVFEFKGVVEGKSKESITIEDPHVQEILLKYGYNLRMSQWRMFNSLKRYLE